MNEGLGVHWKIILLKQVLIQDRHSFTYWLQRQHVKMTPVKQALIQDRHSVTHWLQRQHVIMTPVKQALFKTGVKLQPGFAL